MKSTLARSPRGRGLYRAAAVLLILALLAGCSRFGFRTPGTPVAPEAPASPAPRGGDTPPAADSPAPKPETGAAAPTPAPSPAPGVTSISLDQGESRQQVPLPPPEPLEVGTGAFSLTIGLGRGADGSLVRSGLAVQGTQPTTVGYQARRDGGYLKLDFPAGAAGDEIRVILGTVPAAAGAFTLGLRRWAGPLVTVAVAPGFVPGHGGNWVVLSRVAEAFGPWPALGLHLTFTEPMDHQSVEDALTRALGVLPAERYWNDAGTSLRLQAASPPPRVDLRHLRVARDRDGRPVGGSLPVVWLLPEPVRAHWLDPASGIMAPAADLMPGIRGALLAPDGQRVLLRTEEPNPEPGQWQERLWVADLHRGGWRAVALPAGPAAWLPDGRLAVRTGDRVVTWHPDTAAVTPLPAAETQPDWPEQAFTPAGDLLAGQGPDGRHLVIPRRLTALAADSGAGGAADGGANGAADSPGTLPLTPVPGGAERIRLAPGEPADRNGMFFLHLVTGAAEGWSVPDAWHYDASPDGRWIKARGRDQSYLIDRQGGLVYGYDPDRTEVVAAQGSRVLLTEKRGQSARPSSTGRFTVVVAAAPDEAKAADAPTLQAAATFTLSPGDPTAIFAADGRRLALALRPAGAGDTPADTTLYLVDTATGTAQPIDTLPAVHAGRPLVRIALDTINQGKQLTATLMYGSAPDTDGAVGADLPPPPFVSAVRTYGWDGRRTGELLAPGHGVRLSPDGRLAAWEENLAWVSPAVVVAPTDTGQPRVRVKGASLCYEDVGINVGRRWLADSSALVVNTRAGYRLLSPDGQLQAPPALADADRSAEPLPAPDRPDLFALYRSVVRNAAGEPVQAATLSADPRWHLPGDMDPWGMDSDELRFSTTHLGHDSRCGPSLLLSPMVEIEPLPTALSLQVSGTGSCLNLRTRPALDATAPACLPDGTPLWVTQAAGEKQSMGRTVNWNTGWWIHVRTDTGDQGWVSSDYVDWLRE